jgi:hypothetical protein
MDGTSRRRFLQGGLAMAGLGLLAGCEIAPRLGQRPPRSPLSAAAAWPA